ncbi:hypothetical protein KPH14_000951 [Odynerus spinipes]|uniref:Peptidase aspartic putative domain-containing protein n=1 Tax=Odynerus spinipes TaxID=1348599 RepID=A0AAD9RF62_9HYME|nr:hypothetical protein KPH14_000951 [Odynerus spinipes]
MVSLEQLLKRQADPVTTVHQFLERFDRLLKAKVNEGVIQTRLNALQNLWEKRETLHTNILNAVSVEQHETLPYLMDNVHTKAEDAYFTALDHLNELLDGLREEASPPPSDTISASSRPSPMVQLPRIDLPKFSGDLTGEASNLLKNVTVTEANYLSAWTTLHERYENERVLTDAHFDSFINLPMITSEPSEKLKQLRDTTDEALKALKNLDHPVEHWERIVAFILIQKLDTSTRSAWEKYLVNESGTFIRVRALINQGSESTFITQKIAQYLRVSRQRIYAPITVVNEQVSSVSRSVVNIEVRPYHGSTPTVPFQALVLPKITCYQPPRQASIQNWSHIKDLDLADPDPMNLQPLDALFGVDMFDEIMRAGTRLGKKNEPYAQETIFRWVLSGPIGSPRQAPPKVLTHCTALPDLDTSLRRFWEIKEGPREVPLTREEQQCEDHFVATHSRNEDGRYIVRLPFTSDPTDTIGNSRKIAERMLLRMESRLKRDDKLYSDFKEFMAEYQDFGHMEEFRELKQPLSSRSSIFFPHHSVIRESGSTTRVRVVFNASCRIANGISLNDLLLTGQKLQSDLSLILMRWRMHRSADTITEATDNHDQLIALLNRGKFTLRKWSANDSAILDGLSAAEYSKETDRPLAEDHWIKILGLTWKPASDSFNFTNIEVESSAHKTKREILSIIAQLFDPLGWLAPVVIIAKTLMQELWIRGIDWDSELPDDI